MHDDNSRCLELQELLDKANKELAQNRDRISSLTNHMSELETELATARKDLLKSEELSTKHQRDIREVRMIGGRGKGQNGDRPTRACLREDTASGSKDIFSALLYFR